jgi:glycosyltransferase involved in cell wall biosynthesis
VFRRLFIVNILYHHRTRGKGAEGAHILGMVRAFRELGHIVYIVSPPGTDLDEGQANLHSLKDPKKKILRKVSVSFPEVFFELLEILYNVFAFVQMIFLMRKKKIGFVYERYALFSIAGILLSRIYGIPIILEVNDSAVVERNRKVLFFKIASRMEQWIFYHASNIITVSGVFKEIVVGRGIDEKKIFVTPNAIDPHDFTVSTEARRLVRKQYQLHGKIVVGYVGGFSYWHRLDFLADIIAELTEIYPNIHCMLVGDGANRLFLSQYVRKMGVKKHFTFTGKCNHKQVAKYISAMDITILPDANRYCSPLKLFEYMAMGKPVLAPRLPNVNEILTPGVNGVLFERGKKEDLEKKLSEIIENVELRRNLGNNARRTVYEKHLWIQNAREIIRICKDLGTNL